MHEFIETDICLECNFTKYRHSTAFHDFTDDDTPFAFFTFTLTQEIRFEKDAFSISVSQQGDRLGTYRLKDDSKKFTPSKFNIILGRTDGVFVKAVFGSDFMFSLTNEELNLTPGNYVVMIDPVWNETANN